MITNGRPKTIDASFFSLDEMIAFAATRHRVQLDDGRVATLVRWATPKRPTTARILFFNGNLASVKLNKIKSVEIPITPGDQQ